MAKTRKQIEELFKNDPYYAYREGLMEGFDAAMGSFRNQAATSAMQGLISLGCSKGCDGKVCIRKTGVIIEPTTAARLAVGYADALVKELQKGHINEDTHEDKTI